MKDSDEVAKVIIKNGGKLLFLMRAGEDEYELPGGHLNKGETFLKGAIREVYEETGIKISKMKVVYTERKYILYMAKTKTAKIKLSAEHTKYKWVSSNQILGIQLSKWTRKNLRSIINAI